MELNSVLKAYKGKKVLITGHTGFKGSWMSLWLAKVGATVYGYSMPPPGIPSLFEKLSLKETLNHQQADIRDLDSLTSAVQRIQPDIIFHLAAQSLVGEGYVAPIETMQVNVMGTANVLEAVRRNGMATAIVVVTSDKCYRNKEWTYGYREVDELGGDDPYSASKGAAELMVHSWRNSFFHPSSMHSHGVRLASVRAGNVIGGGDYAQARIVPDCIRYLEAGESIVVRNPSHTRPWQHVLEPLSGYLVLGSKLLNDTKGEYCEAFNFGPNVNSNRSVKDLVDEVISCWGSGSWNHMKIENAVHETILLHVSSDKAFHKLGWEPRWDFKETIFNTVDWYKQAGTMSSSSELNDFTLSQIGKFEDKRILELI
jgi:CDP-glucose 4,6-dehydratase